MIWKWLKMMKIDQFGQAPGSSSYDIRSPRSHAPILKSGTRRWQHRSSGNGRENLKHGDHRQVQHQSQNIVRDYGQQEMASERTSVPNQSRNNCWDWTFQVFSKKRSTALKSFNLPAGTMFFAPKPRQKTLPLHRTQHSFSHNLCISKSHVALHLSQWSCHHPLPPS